MKNFGKMKTFVLHSYYFFKDIYCIGSCSIYSSAVAVYIHQQLQYIFNCRCSIYSFFGCTILYVLFRLLRVRGDEVLAAVDDADKLGVFPFVELVYLIVVLLGHYPAEKALHVREVGVAVCIQVFLSGGYLPEVRYLKKGSYRQLSPASAGWELDANTFCTAFRSKAIFYRMSLILIPLTMFCHECRATVRFSG